jgi:hypothetical protein
LEGLRSENVDIFYGHLEYFTAFEIIYKLWAWFGTFFPVFGIMHHEKSGNPEHI